MIRRIVLILGCALSWACNTAVAVDVEGGACDPGDVCPSGFTCVQGVCHASGGAGGGTGGGAGGGSGLCAGVVCNAPPASTCQSATVARTYTGTCAPSTGQCSYAPADTTCAGGCQGGACVDLCTGQACLSPPAARCADADTLRTFAATGQCVPASGLCTYPSTDTTCANGCQSGACLNQNLCAGVACVTPPSPVCNGQSLRTFASVGSCDPGTGQCAYASTDSACANGCSAGACVGTSLAFTQVGPRLRFQGLAVDQAPGNATDVLVVGLGGHVSRWNGSAWSDVATPSGTPALRSVSFSSNTSAYIVGSGRTAWRYTESPNPAVASVGGFPGGSSGTNFVAVYARADNNVLLADDQGGWARLAPTSTAWTSGSLPGSNGPYAMTSVWLDETNRERIAGACGTAKNNCVGYRNLSSSASFSVHVDGNDTGGLFAVSGSFDLPTSGASTVFVGLSTPGVGTHSFNGGFGNLAITPALEFDGVVGLTSPAAVFTKRTAVYALTTSGGASFAGHLYRLTQPLLGSVSSSVLLDTYFGHDALSPTENNGVVVLESKATGASPSGVNNVFRRGLITDEALDLGEDWFAVTANALGDLILVDYYGDVAFRRSLASTFEFHRGPAYLVSAAEGLNGTGVLLAGQDDTGNNPVAGLERYVGGSFTPIAVPSGATGATLTSVCRVSDSEGWAVGTGGVILSVKNTTATQASSPTTKNLSVVVCGASGEAYACGQGGLVLALVNGNWQTLSPAFPQTTAALTSCALRNGVLWAAGDGVFAKWTVGSGAWQSLSGRAGLGNLVVRSANELYATAPDPTSAANTAILRFDGTSWTSLASFPATLRGGVQVGAKVVYGGSLGAIVEGR